MVSMSQTLYILSNGQFLTLFSYLKFLLSIVELSWSLAIATSFLSFAIQCFCVEGDFLLYSLCDASQRVVSFLIHNNTQITV